MTRVILSLLIFTCFISTAQFSAGDKFLGGDLNVNLSESTPFPGASTKNRLLSVSPSMGFLVSDKLAVGGRLGFGNDNQKTSYGGIQYENLSRSYSGGAFVQRFFTISDKFMITLTGNLSFSRSHVSNPYVNPNDGEVVNVKTNQYGFGASVGPSLLFFPSPNWAISTGLGSLSYSYGYNMTVDASSNTFNLNLGSFGLGVNYFFRKSSDN
jgi:outer membrane protein